MPLPDNGPDRLAAAIIATSATEGDGAPALRSIPMTATGGAPAMGAGEAHLGEVGGKKLSSTAAFTRPADTEAYVAKDVIANATSGAVVMTFAVVARLNGGTGFIVRATLFTSQAANVARHRLHLFNTSPTALQDNATCTAPLYADVSKYIGFIDFGPLYAEGSGSAAYAQDTSLSVAFDCDASVDDIYGILETLDGFTPASAQTYSVTLVTACD